MSSTEEQQHQREAEELLKSRLQDFTQFLAREAIGSWREDPTTGDEELGDVEDYGLEWTKQSTDHRWGTVTYVHVLSTGGPHDEFQVTFDPDTGVPKRILFVYLPWFGRVEIEVEDDEAFDFYEQFFGPDVVVDVETSDHL